MAETFECEVKARDGLRFWVVGNAVATGRETIGRQLTYALLDIERRRQAEALTAQAQASLARVIETAPLAIAQNATNVTGTWAFDVTTDQGTGNPTIVFKQDGETLTGRYTGTFGEADVTGTVKGKDITFSFSADVQGFALTSTYKGTVETATTMKGTLEISQIGTGTFTATKK